MATFSDGEREVLLLPLLSGVCVCSFRPVYPADPDCVDTSKPGRSRQLPHLDRLSDKSVEMRPNLFFINFNRSGDCLFVFLRYIFHGLFSFLWLEFSHYNQSENRPFFKYPLSKCAQFSGRYLSNRFRKIYSEVFP